MRATEAQALSDGHKIRWTLERLHQESQHKVRIDWLRVTVPLDAVVRCDAALPPDLDALALMDRDSRDMVRMARSCDASLGYTGAQAVSRSAVLQVSEVLGLFELGLVDDRGMDFYSSRAAFVHEGATVGWALAGGKSPAQAGTVHINLFGSACLHVSHEKWAALRRWVESANGHITRVDLALDIFKGFDIVWAQDAYKAGEFDMRGKRPGQREIGSWTLGHSRTFEVGSRGTGKVCRAYEKGDELLGAEANDPMVRIECEFRSNHRVIDLDVLDCPADYFAGAYPFCARVLAEQSVDVSPVSIRTVSEAAEKVVDAAAIRVVRWLKRTAGPALARVFWDGGDLVASIVESEGWRVPRRFAGFSRTAVADALAKVAEGLAPSSVPFANGAA